MDQSMMCGSHKITGIELEAIFGWNNKRWAVHSYSCCYTGFMCFTLLLTSFRIFLVAEHYYTVRCVG